MARYIQYSPKNYPYTEIITDSVTRLSKSTIQFSATHVHILKTVFNCAFIFWRVVHVFFTFWDILKFKAPEIRKGIEIYMEYNATKALVDKYDLLKNTSEVDIFFDDLKFVYLKPQFISYSKLMNLNNNTPLNKEQKFAKSFSIVKQWEDFKFFHRSDWKLVAIVARLVIECSGLGYVFIPFDLYSTYQKQKISNASAIPV